MGGDQEGTEPVLRVVFYRTEAGNEPVRQWLKSLKREDRKAIGEDVKTAQYGWPLGMPLIRKLEPGLWEVRSHITQGIARILFTVDEGALWCCCMALSRNRRRPRRRI
jgi:phage-related protein